MVVDPEKKANRHYQINQERFDRGRNVPQTSHLMLSINTGSRRNVPYTQDQLRFDPKFSINTLCADH